jgi:hypothetical protein
MGARSNGILIARAKTRTAQGRLSIKLEKSPPMALAAKFRGHHPFFTAPCRWRLSTVQWRQPFAMEPVNVRYAGVERTLSECIATSEFDPERTLGSV